MSFSGRAGDETAGESFVDATREVIHCSGIIGVDAYCYISCCTTRFWAVSTDRYPNVSVNSARVNRSRKFCRYTFHRKVESAASFVELSILHLRQRRVVYTLKSDYIASTTNCTLIERILGKKIGLKISRLCIRIARRAICFIRTSQVNFRHRNSAILPPLIYFTFHRFTTYKAFTRFRPQ